MKQYRITAADFNKQDSHIPDAYIPVDDLAQIKHLAGLGKGLLEDYMSGSSSVEQHKPNDQDMPSPSPVGTVADTPMGEKRQIERDLNIKVGTPEWFRLYFARPELTGEKPVGDAKPDSEPNPRYLLDKDGRANPDRVQDLSAELDQKRGEL